jgi:hypothetical protein
VNKGLVAFGVIPSNATDSFGETLGGLGSAIAIKRGTFKKSGTSFSGTLRTQADRGYNVVQTIDWQGRHHLLDFEFTPYTASTKLSYSQAKDTFKVTYKETIVYSERSGVPVSGLDPAAVRAPSGGDPQVPIAAATYPRLSLDAEGLVENSDGSFWVSEEYGPYIYHVASNGTILSAITPPAAVIPTIGGAVNFTAVIEPTTGRSANQGFEGLTASPDGCTLYALLQSALAQDGGGDKATNRYTRLFAWNVTKTSAPQLVGEYVVPLPQSKKPKTYAQSEIHYINPTQFLVLSRDGNGHGDTDSKSDYKSIDIIDISAATDIHGTNYDTTTAVAPKGVLASGVKPAQYTPFVSLVDSTQLQRFGLHNDGDFDETLIDAKWESLALAPAMDPAFPDDYFLFTVADNDFITLNGISLGQPYSAGDNVNTQIFVFRITLPAIARGSVEKSIGI